MTVEELFAAVGQTDNGRPIREAWLSAECPRCGREVALKAMTRTETENPSLGEQTEYICSCGGVPVVINPIDMVNGNYNYWLQGDRELPCFLSPAVMLWIRLPGDRTMRMRGGRRPES